MNANTKTTKNNLRERPTSPAAKKPWSPSTGLIVLLSQVAAVIAVIWVLAGW